ncbi:Na+/H+ antiporter subunit E [Pseudonocardia sichuanensis]|uniref:Multisubunit sodium/proton antiporter MrpE subunit n=1 Tax=Pseudonocardia kunmingensis TaxID=630975 RepID=A0A543DZ29_9PSEU|nr:Na+/H+ antiporter subunit E [Pseudonocardia kunmingensis]TQM14590.1 multisubunit sodium/proton antiporter MrpE subunit [Pseudonocardia kunmingensis]
MTVPDERGGRGLARRIRARLPSVLWLTVVWVLLWGTFTVASVVGGVLVALLVTGLFRLPLSRERLPLRPLRLVGLLCYLVYDLVVSGAEVSWQVVRHGPRARSAIIAVPLLSGSDRVVTVMANALSLSPGTMALQIDHDHDVWYVYALGPRDEAGVDRIRRRTLDMQRRVLAALGSPAEVAEAERLVAAVPVRRAS